MEFTKTAVTNTSQKQNDSNLSELQRAELGQKLKQLRLNHINADGEKERVSQSDLAEMAKLSRRTISTIEDGNQVKDDSIISAFAALGHKVTIDKTFSITAIV